MQRGGADDGKERLEHRANITIGQATVRRGRAWLRGSHGVAEDIMYSALYSYISEPLSQVCNLLLGDYFCGSITLPPISIVVIK